MYRFSAALLAIAAVGCGDSKKADDKANPAEPEPVEVRIALGDCASAMSRFESGPRPRPTADVIGDELALDEIAASDAPPTKPVDAGPESDPKTGIDPRDDAIRQASKAGILGVLTQSPGGAFASLMEVRPPIDPYFPYGDGKIGGANVGSLPRVWFEKSKVAGNLDAGIIRRYLRRQERRIRNCYELELASKPDLRGKLTLRFAINARGRVEGIEASGLGSANVESCVAKVVESIKFPRPDGGLVKVTYPIGMVPGEKADSEPDAGVGGAKAKPMYVPGASNPLASVRASVVQCVREAKVGHGVVVVELTAGADGALTATNAIAANDSLATCVATSARSIKLAPSERETRSYRCPLAFGELDVGKAAGIDITPDVVRYHGLEVERVREITEDQGMAWKLVSLYGRLDADAKARTEAKSAFVIGGLDVIRPVPTTKAKVLFRVLVNARRVPREHVLAANRAGTWAIIRSGITLPVAPVPFGQGGSWGPQLSRAGPSIGLAVLLTATELFVGHGGKISQIAKSGSAHNIASMTKELEVFRKLASLQGARAIEISGEDDVTYSEIVAVIDAVTKLGFDHWVLVEPGALSVPFKD